MPDTVTTTLTPEETASRRDAVRAAMASARIGRAPVSDGAQTIMELYVQGHISEEEMIVRVDRLCIDG